MGTVLVVDDEFGIAELIVAVLEDEGHRVVTAVNGKQGLEVLSRETVGLVFLDYMMPVLDGAAVLSSMQLDEGLQAIPVVMMSSLPEATVAERCSGYAAFLRKPFRIVNIIALVDEFLNKDIRPTA